MVNRQLGDLQRQIDELKGQRIGGGGLNDMRNEAGETSGMMDLLVGKVKNLGVVAAGITAALGIAGFVAGAVSVTDEYQKAMNQLQMSTGVWGEDMERYKESAKNLYSQNLGEDWQDVAKSMATTASVTKLTGNELEMATEHAILMRDVFEFEVNESVKASDTMMKNFGVSSFEAFNLLAQGAQNGLNKSDELIDSANEYSPYFASLGFTANQMFDTFSAGLEAGAFNLDKVGDAVKEFNIRSKDGSTSSSEAFQALGLDAEHMAQVFATGGPAAQAAFQEVVQAISAVEDPVEKNAIGVGLFGTQFEDLEKDVVAAMGTAREQFDMTDETMNTIGELRFDNMGDAFSAIGRKLETGLLIPIGEALLPAIQWVADKIDGVLPLITSFGGQFGGVMSRVFEIAQSIGSSIFAGFEQMMPFFRSVGSVVIGFLTPIVLLVKDTIIPGIMGVISTVAPYIVAVVGKIGAAINAIWTYIQPVLGMILEGFNFVFPVIQAVVSNVFDAIGGVISGVLTVIGGIIDFVTGVFSGDWELAWQGVKDIFVGIFDTLGSILAAPINFVIDLINMAIRGINSISIDVPEWVPMVGGETYGVSIPEIPKIGGYADGGVVDRPELAWIGEGGDTEVVVPINSSPRSRALWQTAGNMLGVDQAGGDASGGGTTYVFHYSPQISGYNKDDIAPVIEEDQASFEKRMTAFVNQQRRVQFG